MIDLYLQFLPHFGIAIGALILLPFIWLIIGIILSILVYKDAESRGENGALWLLVVLITGIIGLIIWLIVRPRKKPIGREKGVKYCSECGSRVTVGDKYCKECGNEL